MLIVFSPIFLCVWNQMPRRNPQTLVLPQDILHAILLWLEENLKSEKLRIFSDDFLNFKSRTIEKQCLMNLSSSSSKINVFVHGLSFRILGCSLWFISLSGFGYKQLCNIEKLGHQTSLPSRLLYILDAFCFFVQRKNPHSVNDQRREKNLVLTKEAYFSIPNIKKKQL